MRMGAWIGALSLLVVGMPVNVAAQGRQAPPPQPLTYEMAKVMAEAAEAEARRSGWNMTIIVADSQGVPVYLKRMTGAAPRTVDFATGKIRAVIGSGLPSAEYGERLRAGTAQEVPNAVPFGGGRPVMLDGVLIGAIAASGARPEDDDQVALAGAEALPGS